MTIGKKIWGWVGVVLLLMITGLFLISGRLREWRSHQLSIQATTALEAGNYEAALEKARAGHFLNPDDPVVLHRLAEVADKAAPREAPGYWEKLVDMPGTPAEVRASLAESWLRLREVKKAREALEAYRALSPEAARGLSLEARLAAYAGRFSEALSFGRRSVLADDASNEHLLDYYRIAEASGEVSFIQHASERILAFANEHQNESSLELLRMLETSASFPSELVGQLALALRENPASGRQDKLGALMLEEKTGVIDAKDMFEKARALFILHVDEERLELARWANSHQYHTLALELLPEELAIRRRDWLLVRLDALALTDRWDAVQTLLGTPGLPLDNHLRQLFRMRALLREGHERRAGLAWESALLEVRNKPEEIWFLFRYVERLGLEGYMREALQNLIRHPGHMRVAFRRWLNLEQGAGRSRELLAVYERMDAALPPSPEIRNDLIYLRLLLGDAIELRLEEARQLVEESPRLVAPHVTLALALLENGLAPEAEEHLRSLQFDWINTQSRYKVVRALVLHASGATTAAQDLLATVRPEVLLPEERLLMERISGKTG